MKIIPTYIACMSLAILSFSLAAQTSPKKACKPIRFDNLIFDNADSLRMSGLISVTMYRYCLKVEALFEMACQSDDVNLYWTGKKDSNVIDLMVYNDGSKDCNHSLYKAMHFDLRPIIEVHPDEDSLVFKVHGIDKSLSTVHKRPKKITERNVFLTFMSEDFISESEEVIKIMGNVRTSYSDGSYKLFDRDRNVRISGNYIRNRRDGEWIYYYSDSVRGIRQYKDGLLLEETFVDKNQEPFEGLLTDFYPPNKKNHAYEIKGGLRHGLSIDYYSNDRPFREAKYKNGIPKEPEQNLTALLNAGEIRKTFEVQEKFNGKIYLILDKIVLTDQHTFVFCHYQNEFYSEISHGIRIKPPGAPHCFKLVDMYTNKDYQLLNSFNITTYENTYTPVRIGELLSFVLVFEPIPEDIAQLSITSGQVTDYVEIDDKTITLDDHFYVIAPIK